MANKEVDAIVAEQATKYPSLITTEQAAEIAHLSVSTIHAWSSFGRLDGFAHKVGRRVLLQRDAFVRHICRGS